jgi:hypothetical protein
MPKCDFCEKEAKYYCLDGQDRCKSCFNEYWFGEELNKNWWQFWK